MGVIIIPIKPIFAYRIFTRKKRYELRKSTCSGELVKPGDRAILYVSGGVKAFMGEFTVGEVHRGSPDHIYRLLSRIRDTGVSDVDFTYIQGVKCALAMEVVDPFMYRIPVEMKEVLRIFPDYSPPRGIQRVDEYEPIVKLVFDKAREFTKNSAR